MKNVLIIVVVLVVGYLFFFASDDEEINQLIRENGEFTYSAIYIHQLTVRVDVCREKYNVDNSKLTRADDNIRNWLSALESQLINDTWAGAYKKIKVQSVSDAHDNMSKITEDESIYCSESIRQANEGDIPPEVIKGLGLS